MSLNDGRVGASAPGGSETLAAIMIAQKNCAKPDLTIQDILKEKNFTPQDIFKQYNKLSNYIQKGLIWELILV